MRLDVLKHCTHLAHGPFPAGYPKPADIEKACKMDSIVEDGHDYKPGLQFCQ